MLPLHCDIQTFIEYAVAPYVGAWIETSLRSGKKKPHPVAPYVGAWIETSMMHSKNTLARVAPYVGAWIETEILPNVPLIVTSHPTWVRGLKLPCIITVKDEITLSHPTWVRGLKQITLGTMNDENRRTLRGCVD